MITVPAQVINMFREVIAPVGIGLFFGFTIALGVYEEEIRVGKILKDRKARLHIDEFYNETRVIAHDMKLTCLSYQSTLRCKVKDLEDESD